MQHNPTRIRADRLAWSAILLAALGWGTGGAATRAAFQQDLGPYTIAALRSLLAAAAVVAFLVLGGRGLSRTGPAIRLGIVMGVVNLATPFVFFTLAVSYASAGFVGLVTAVIPLGTAVWAHFLLPAERLYPAKVGAMSIALAGVAVLVLSGDSGLASGGNVALATICTLVAVTSASFAGVWAKRHAADYDPLRLTGIQFVVGAVILLVAMLIAEGLPGPITGAGAGLIGYLAAASTFLPFLLFFWVLRRVTAVQASLVGYIVPLVAVAAGIVFLDEQLQNGLVMGGVLILAGVLLTDRLERRVAGK